MKEQRHHPRVPSRERCWCESEDITLFARIENLSEGGLFLRGCAPLARGAQVRLRLGSGTEQVSTVAAVAWRRGKGASGEEVGMGLRFEAVDKRAAAALRDHVDRLMRNEA